MKTFRQSTKGKASGKNAAPLVQEHVAGVDSIFPELHQFEEHRMTPKSESATTVSYHSKQTIKLFG